MDSKTILDDLNNPNSSLTGDRIKTYLMETMLAFTVEHTANLSEVIEVGELIRTKQRQKVQPDVMEVVNKLHALRKELPDSSKRQFDEKEMEVRLSELLDVLTSERY